MILPNSPELVGAANLTWQQHLKMAVRSPEELARRLNLSADLVCPGQSEGPFPLFVPLPFLARMQIGNPEDPLLRQVLPVDQENRIESGSTDPVAESEFEVVPGLLHKYHGRALMVINGICAIHCRYCFRRHFPYDQLAVGRESWQAALRAIGQDASIAEVILSGGDPLMMVDSMLEELIHQIEMIDHVARIRIHSRLPVVIPQRITDQLIANMQDSRLEFVFVVHCNHANEIDDTVEKAFGRLKSVSSAILNQSVLLRGVNDNADCLVALSQRLFASGVMPYYLHQLDPVRGAMHFEVPTRKGIQLMDEVRGRLPGYLVPRYVREIPGQPGKTVLA